MSLDNKLKKICDTLGGYEGNTDFEIDEAVTKIKQIFIEEGYIKYKETKGTAKIIKAVATKHFNMLTGQEWYERFENELGINLRAARLSALTENKLPARMLEAAKRASGEKE